MEGEKYYEMCVFLEVMEELHISFVYSSFSISLESYSMYLHIRIPQVLTRCIVNKHFNLRVILAYSCITMFNAAKGEVRNISA
jgi:hypothetical protein